MGDSEPSTARGTRKILKSDLSNIKRRYLSIFGFLSAYLVFSGTIALFIYLRYLGVAEALAGAIEPLGNVGVAIVTLASFIANLAMVFATYIILVLAIGTNVIWIEEIEANHKESSSNSSETTSPMDSE